jgi:hypothetical protein
MGVLLGKWYIMGLICKINDPLSIKIKKRQYLSDEIEDYFV